MKPLRLMRTLSYIPPRMLGSRLAYRARCLFYISPFYSFWQDVSPPKKLLITPPHLWTGHKNNAAHIANGNFVFQNHFQNLASNLTDPLLATRMNWLPEGTTPLWTFTLHYFEWLADLRAHKTPASLQAAQTLLADWLLEHDSFHPLIWHPYPTSLRLVSWFTHAEWLMKNADKSLKEAFHSSLLRQTHHLEKNCETWLGGNHLLKNLKALVYAGLCLPGQHALFWRSLNKFLTELNAQILPDGMHNERSPSYHVQVLKDVLDIHALTLKAGHTPPHGLTEILERMTAALACLKNPDGTLPLFNDGETHTKTEIAQLIKRCGGIPNTPTALPEAGYARLAHTGQKGKKGLSAFFDAGYIGPHQNPGHAHADTLAFELFYGDEKILTNQGTFLYQTKSRNHYRSTAAHNTVDIDGLSSSDVWSAFRVGRRPTHVTLNITGQKNKGLTATGTHNGYRHLGVTHTRKLTLNHDGALTGEDTLTCKNFVKATAHFHCHPDITLKLHNEREAYLTTPTGKKLKLTLTKGRLIPQTYDYAPHFGHALPAQKLLISLPRPTPSKKTRKKIKHPQSSTLLWQIEPL